ncbi:histone-lysine N-methyltransferase PRDM9 [Plutella xylostella]|nr:histone-lysine N-methyltransferase PRDM9 [Plutella xylostella]
MDEICRLCCSSGFVKNYIFDEETALHLKMSLYMPIKVLKDDRLPQKICDKCSCKVNDLYQFCNEAIEVQNRLQAATILPGLVEDSNGVPPVKHCLSPPPDTSLLFPLSTITHCDQGTQTELCPEPLKDPYLSQLDSTQNKSDFKDLAVKIKEEPEEEDYVLEVKPESSPNHFSPHRPSDDSDDNMSLETLKMQKRKRKHKKGKTSLTNGDVNTKTKKRKNKASNEWEMLVKALPVGTTIGVVNKSEEVKLPEVKKEEDSDGLEDLDMFPDLSKKVKQEPKTFNCCMCFMKCFNKQQMLEHYRCHADDTDLELGPPPPPPIPEDGPPKCTRCNKVVEPELWAAHWQRHWERDKRPYRCARCERAFRDANAILKHGVSHDEEADSETQRNKRFLCDQCPEGFFYMRYLLSHRARAHPAASAEPLALRCAECDRTFAHLNSLRRHQRAHSGEKNHLCNVCGKALSSREHLKFHIRIHTGYKPNVCKTCGKGFVKKCNLTLHERTHSGEKPHVCQHCSKAFSQRSTLVIHERYHSGARPYVCGLCGRGFVAKGLLSMHLKTTCI